MAGFSVNLPLPGWLLLCIWRKRQTNGKPTLIRSLYSSYCVLKQDLFLILLACPKYVNLPTGWLYLHMVEND